MTTRTIKDWAIPINRTHLRAVSLFAPKDDIRYYLNGVLVHITDTAIRLVATDGHTLIVAQTEYGVRPWCKQEKIIVPVDVCKRFADDKDDTEILVSPIDEAERLKMESIALSINFTPVEGNFPDYENLAILPQETSGVPGQFNTEFVKRFGKAASILAKDSVPYIAHNGLDRPAIVHFASDHNVLGILMPMTLSESVAGLPPWLKPRSALADLESASGNLPGVESKEEAEADKPVAKAGDAERASAADKGRKRKASEPAAATS